MISCLFLSAYSIRDILPSVFGPVYWSLSQRQRPLRHHPCIGLWSTSGYCLSWSLPASLQYPCICLLPRKSAPLTRHEVILHPLNGSVKGFLAPANKYILALKLKTEDLIFRFLYGPLTISPLIQLVIILLSFTLSLESNLFGFVQCCSVWCFRGLFSNLFMFLLV